MKTNTKIFALASLSLLWISFTGCYSWFETKTPLDKKSQQITLDDFFYKASVITSLDCPTQVIASQGLYNGTIKVSWSQVDNATSYRIERAVIKPDQNGKYAVPEEGDFEVLSNTKYVYNTNYTDVILSNPGSLNNEYSYKYYYRICAENIGKGLESSEYTNISNPATNACGWLFPPPYNIDASKGKSKTDIKITWSPSDNAAAYLVYRSQKENSGYELVSTTKGNKTFYIDTITEKEQGMEFYYKVQAQLANGNLSSFSNTSVGYSLVEGAPVPPDNIRLTHGYAETTGSLSVAWDPLPSSEGKTITYILYRTSSVDPAYQLIGKFDSSKTFYEDKNGLKQGIFYYYYIQTLITDDATGEILKSSFSETGPDSETVVTGFLLSAPQEISISDSENKDMIILRWTPAAGYEAPYNLTFRYNIFYDSEKDGNFEAVVQKDFLPETLDEKGYYEIEIPKKDFIKISTSYNGITSSLSKAAAPCPEAPLNVEATKTKDIGLEAFKPNTNNVYPVKITWQKPEKDNPYGYNIYRSTKTDSSFRKLNDSVIPADSKSSFSYIDENETARAGTIYYYKVVSLNVLGDGKNGNDPATDSQRKCMGYGALTREEWFREYNKTTKNSQSKLTLMHKPNDMDKLGSETVNGDISGTLSYKASIAGLGAEITMHYTNYADFYINNDPDFGVYFLMNGNTDTTSNMSANGTMHESVVCTGMYPGTAGYNKLEIKGGAAGGGYYEVETKDLDGNIILVKDNISWLIGEE